MSCDSTIRNGVCGIPSEESAQAVITGSGAGKIPVVAGMLAYLPAIWAFAMPTEISYDRVLDSGWTDGT
jgi:hypothetical protein